MYRRDEQQEEATPPDGPMRRQGHSARPPHTKSPCSIPGSTPRELAQLPTTSSRRRCAPSNVPADESVPPRVVPHEQPRPPARRTRTQNDFGVHSFSASARPTYHPHFEYARAPWPANLQTLYRTLRDVLGGRRSHRTRPRASRHPRYSAALSATMTSAKPTRQAPLARTATAFKARDRTTVLTTRPAPQSRGAHNVSAGDRMIRALAIRARQQASQRSTTAQWSGEPSERLPHDEDDAPSAVKHAAQTARGGYAERWGRAKERRQREERRKRQGGTHHTLIKPVASRPLYRRGQRRVCSTAVSSIAASSASSLSSRWRASGRERPLVRRGEGREKYDKEGKHEDCEMELKGQGRKEGTHIRPAASRPLYRRRQRPVRTIVARVTRPRVSTPRRGSEREDEKRKREESEDQEEEGETEECAKGKRGGRGAGGGGGVGGEEQPRGAGRMREMREGRAEERQPNHQPHGASAGKEIRGREGTGRGEEEN
ncbi:hypothetical protein B0H10DRAFT_1949417 [Mycena sp. CBHHK59/15]|nr:hypothetical protein B0H10DRAFT_1949417 [Mycena sp. CBHHK59/15]